MAFCYTLTQMIKPTRLKISTMTIKKNFMNRFKIKTTGMTKPTIIAKIKIKILMTRKILKK